MIQYKNILLIITTLMLQYTASSQELITIKTDIYEALYNTTYQQPVQVNYTVFCKPDSPTYERDGITFKPYPGIKTSSSSDYAGNIYDKGHMAPASTFACTEKWLRETFSYANCALQHQGLNRGVWSALERFERNLAGIYEEVDVEISVYFSEKWTSNSDPARIPSSFIKTISWTERGKNKSISFEFPNEDTTGKSFWNFKIK
jgi:DNA/RNA endonuclease G (NUC1)